MITFNLDENFSCVAVVAACSAEGKCIAKVMAKSLKGTKDPNLLPVILSGISPLVTFDGAIVEEHRDFIPDRNPGVVVVRLRRPSKSMTWRIGLKLLAAFKKNYPTWELTDYSGLRLEINETGIMISNIKSDADYCVIEYADPKFLTQASQRLPLIQPTSLAS